MVFFLVLLVAVVYYAFPGTKSQEAKVLYFMPLEWADRFGVDGNSRHLLIEGFVIMTLLSHCFTRRRRIGFPLRFKQRS